jgi:hypothetical protein
VHGVGTHALELEAHTISLTKLISQIKLTACPLLEARPTCPLEAHT